MLLLIFLSFIHKDEARDESDLSDSDMINGSYGATYEFEVDKLSDSENLESQDIASGTDVRWIFSLFYSISRWGLLTISHFLQDDVQSPLFAYDSSTSGTEPNDSKMIEQDADIEESDGSIDQELKRVDFSVCLKCKRVEYIVSILRKMPSGKVTITW